MESGLPGPGRHHPILQHRQQLPGRHVGGGDQEATPTFVIHGPKGTVVVQGDVPESQITQAMQQVNGGKV